MRRMRRLLPHPLLTLVLTLVWLLLVNSAAPGSILVGLGLGWAIPQFTRHFWPTPVRIYRPLTLARFVGTVLGDIVIANLTVARLILERPGKLQPAFIMVPLTLRSELALSLLANTISLTPGTVSARLAPDRRHLLVHALDTTDTDQLAATLKHRYETPLREIFESC